MNKELVEQNLACVKDILEKLHNDKAAIFVAFVNEDGNPVLETIECSASELPPETLGMLFSAGLAATQDSSDVETKTGYFLKPMFETTEEIQ